MAQHLRQSRKIIKNVRQEDAPGVRMDPGPHIGIVKHTADKLRTGGLMVYIPTMGGDPDDPNNQRLVQYASPFFGHTNFQQSGPNKLNSSNTFETARHSYGMFFTPPDIGVKVLCMFANGDANNGFWFACIPPAVEHNMTASAGGAVKNTVDVRDDPVVKALIDGYSAAYCPTVEYNGAADNAFSTSVLANKRPPHRVQAKILAEQGLLGDPERGVDASTTTRESPSGVFGITTPGRTVVDQTTDDYLQRVTLDPVADPKKINELVEYGRKGGHQFIMDDGDKDNWSRRMKMRTAAGHQIVMDDTNGFIYISNSTGKAWVELTNDGQMLMYLEKGASLRYGGDLNVQVDGDYNLNVNGNYNLNVDNLHKTSVFQREEVVLGDKSSVVIGDTSLTITGDLAIETINGEIGIIAANTMALKSGDGGWDGGDFIHLQADAIHWNGPTPPEPVNTNVPDPFEVNTLPDTAKIGDIWTYGAADQLSIVNSSPTHEPYGARSSIVTPLVSKTGTPTKRI